MVVFLGAKGRCTAMRGHLSPTPAQNTRVKRCDSQHKSPAALARLYSEMAEGILLQLVDAAAQGVHLQADERVTMEHAGKTHTCCCGAHFFWEHLYNSLKVRVPDDIKRAF